VNLDHQAAHSPTRHRIHSHRSVGAAHWARTSRQGLSAGVPRKADTPQNGTKQLLLLLLCRGAAEREGEVQGGQQRTGRHVCRAHRLLRESSSSTSSTSVKPRRPTSSSILLLSRALLLLRCPAVIGCPGTSSNHFTPVSVFFSLPVSLVHSQTKNCRQAFTTPAAPFLRLYFTEEIFLTVLFCYTLWR